MSKKFQRNTLFHNYGYQGLDGAQRVSKLCGIMLQLICFTTMFCFTLL